MSQKKTLDRTVLAVAVVGILVLVNVIGLYAFGRLDLTRDRQFTLSDATEQMLSGLKDPVTVRAYFTADLPPPYSTNARYVKDLLDEYYNAADGNLRYELIDPLAEETEEDKEKKKDLKQDIFGRAVREATSVERELQALGIQPVQVRSTKADKFEAINAYMGLAIQFGDEKEVIPVVKDTASLEYDLTTLIRKMTREKTPKIALVTGHDGLAPDKELSRVWQLLGQVYELTQLDLGQQQGIPSDVDAILVVGPKTPFSEEEKRAIDAFVISGRGAAFLLDAVRPDLQTLQTAEMDHGLGDLLKAYGVELLPGLVLDRQCAPINLMEQRGFMRIQHQVPYPFIPFPKALDPDHPLTRGLGGVPFPFMSPVSTAFAEQAGVKAEALVRSSEGSWVQEPPYDLDPRQQWTVDMVTDEGAKSLVVTVSGAVKSYAGESAATSARVLVAGGASFMADQFMTPANEAFVMNLIDWLVLDEGLLSVRSRGLAAAPLDEVGDGMKSTVKYANIIGVPLVLVGLGLVRWRVRERRRREVKL